MLAEAGEDLRARHRRAGRASPLQGAEPPFLHLPLAALHLDEAREAHGAFRLAAHPPRTQIW